MEFKINVSPDRNDHREFIAVPTDPDGAFIVDTGSHYGRRVYDDLEVRVPSDEREAALAGDFSSTRERVRRDTEAFGTFNVIPGVLCVPIELPGSGNTVHHDVTKLQELKPAFGYDGPDY